MSLLLAGKHPRRRTVVVPPAKPRSRRPPQAKETCPHDATEQPVPPSGDAKPVQSAPSRPIKLLSKVPFSTSLADRCRNVIVAYLERYPPAALAGLDSQEWDTLVTQRHAQTKPTKGQGGLDGTGRLTPALSERFLAAVEAAAPHLVTPVTDARVWRDCVNYRFRLGGSTRPRVLEMPWPHLVEQVQQWGTALPDKKQAPKIISRTIDHASLRALQDAPMSIALLQATGIGKTVKKVIKYIQQNNKKQGDDPTGCLETLTKILNRWKAMAAAEQQPDADDWKIAETCHSWKALYQGLKQREESRRSALGQRIRENRDTLNADRPKIVKVRPVKKPQHARILHGGGTARGPPIHPKLQKLRQEAATIVQRTRPPSASAQSTGSFARAVSVAGGKRPASGGSKPGQSSVKRLKAAPRGAFPPPSGPSRHKPAF